MLFFVLGWAALTSVPGISMFAPILGTGVASLAIVLLHGLLKRTPARVLFELLASWNRKIAGEKRVVCAVGLAVLS
ncbi:hypothetical protein SAMN04489834_3475 [Microterricola viridarii]|uniref:Uncharacterized protein n=1 Tax=Microterricola viridarii TaxID=412690 RepID=A0A1H1ZIQ6_9MICO|nr:hypothetical protein SAMN04489834_3475 [Microterricola viridarii]